MKYKERGFHVTDYLNVGKIVKLHTKEIKGEKFGSFRKRDFPEERYQKGQRYTAISREKKHQLNWS